MDATIPLIEVADHADALSVGCPDSEMHAIDRIVPNGTCAQLLPGPVVRAFREQVQVVVTEDTAAGVRIAEDLGRPVRPCHAQHVAEHRRRVRCGGQRDLEQAIRMTPCHRNGITLLR